MNSLVPLPRIALGLMLGATCSISLAATPEEKIADAMSAAPPSISANATILDWPADMGGEMAKLREGSNGWTCLPDMPTTSGKDPMCLDPVWMDWAHAWMSKLPLTNKGMGFGYMLQGGSPESNTDPYATEPTASNEWITEPVPHLMILVPDAAMLEDLPTEHTNGGPWVMWKDTPYVHIMAPMPAYRP
ncbi:hypothetical protein [Oceanisphaera sp. KMM 10153]|uniref:hypothetical protein n=1 Tax=Oceanisphaera submarina TaxID=3390193 RepID=UPI003976DEEE